MWKFQRKPSYSKNLDVLVAVITHLGYTDWNMRSVKNLAKALNMDEKSILNVLEKFNSLFCKSSYVSPKGTIFYRMHIRHALRWRDNAVYEEESKEAPLEPASVNAMLDFVVKCADQERRHSLGYLTTWVAAFVSIAAAIIAIIK